MGIETETVVLWLVYVLGAPIAIAVIFQSWVRKADQ